MSDDMMMKEQRHGDPAFEAGFELMEAMRAATMPIIEKNFPDIREGIACLMSAATYFAGIQAGILMEGGAFQPRDRRQLESLALGNFKQGMKYGAKRCASINGKGATRQ